jgi:hypothetical protein
MHWDIPGQLTDNSSPFWYFGWHVHFFWTYTAILKFVLCGTFSGKFPWPSELARISSPTLTIPCLTAVRLVQRIGSDLVDG